MNFEIYENKSTESYISKILNFVPKLQPKKERTIPSPLHLVKDNKINYSYEYSKPKKTKMIQNIKYSNSLKLSNKIKQNNTNKSFNIKKIIIENINIENKKNISKKLIFNMLIKKNRKN
jgi:hypothetical protein